ncbi:hypothetical protein CDL15_Pgr012426 [Punica granatum]|uniref:Uncharacterized protein n=1 Tax=Punica granatum TaxID=22663 RepID=A0A218WYD1_PUNGR|nr:hypothetical protein CDL15_Pgr012426 [Punica granatum]
MSVTHPRESGHSQAARSKSAHAAPTRVHIRVRTVVTELPYFLKHPTQDEQDFQVTEEYILHFYWWSRSAHEDFTGSPRPEGSTPHGAPSSVVIQAKLTSLKSKRDCLRQEIAEKDEQLIDQRQLQRELAQARAELQRHDQELARANAALERSRKRARGATTHFCTTGESCQPSRVDHLRSSPLHGKTCCDQRPFIPATHPARQASRANLHGQVTCGLHSSSMARRAVDRGLTHLSGRD